MTARPQAACHAFEARLASPDRPERLDGFEDPHVGDCPECAGLLAALQANEALLASLASPELPGPLRERLVAAQGGFAVRLAAQEVLSLLSPGALQVPEMTPETRARLASIPAARARAPRRVEVAPPASPAGPEAIAPAGKGSQASPPRHDGVLRGLFRDWRFAVGLAYAATLVIVTVLGVDPLTAARSTASGLTAAGERAIAEARSAATARLESFVAAKSREPLTSQLSYRVYRTLAVGKARASAYAEVIWEGVFGGLPADQSSPSPGVRSPRTPREASEPRDSALRS